ncbi:hypothetical protein GOODEAATRI_016066 [Goodea atripinnis]|uniref:Uncharacterized protein n=1 Tax=Goodea atripinnis TaxID=208336 RepID=A0ABV0NB11_9TELE
MILIAVAQVFCEDGDPKEGADYWTSSNQIQDDWLSNDPFREILLRMTRKPRPHQFIGLMGKRSMGSDTKGRWGVPCYGMTHPLTDATERAEETIPLIYSTYVDVTMSLIITEKESARIYVSKDMLEFGSSPHEATQLFSYFFTSE